ncbi:unnamed protein product [Bursaphelenchus xylophilus]|uniref:(pine wood nematode) hypothetical protein n=1 Tax=Bursaphelenchus xylophilus TaxID=6326 RepID=A0A1I7RZK9_BURXY|nr:unnamed protein product [Bursaphelenchus xylophilus]CAG9111351.1 unnamed protein product [Bursaphelenchus xylophilus]
MGFPPFGRFFLIYLAFWRAHAQTPRTYSTSILYVNDIEVTVNGDFEKQNQAYLIMDFKATFGDLRGSVVVHGREQCQLMESSKPITCRISQVAFMIENPVNALYIEALPSLTFYDKTKDVENLTATPLFNIRNETFNQTTPTQVQTVLNSRSWPITLNYRKGCSDEHYYGFQCNVQCFQPRENECYECNAVTGAKICCNNTDVDQDTCLYKNGVIPPGRNCDERLKFLGVEYDKATARRDLFFWLMLAFILLFVLVLLLLIMAIIWAFSNKRKYEESKEFIINRDYYEEDRTYPQAVSNLNNDTNRSNLNIDQYDRSLRRKKDPLQSPTPERKRRKPVFQEDDDESSTMDYLPFHREQRPYAVSTILPPPQRRRRLEQVV